MFVAEECKLYNAGEQLPARTQTPSTPGVMQGSSLLPWPACRSNLAFKGQVLPAHLASSSGGHIHEAEHPIKINHCQPAAVTIQGQVLGPTAQQVLAICIEPWQAKPVNNTAAASHQQQMLMSGDGTDGVCRAVGLRHFKHVWRLQQQKQHATPRS
jgi:hypothetical protein